ncbi:hypothetical protein [Candidatus Methylomirabilis limnetica]|uniref:hypothetical protein n=1 Tax=Candidatus Methylomirabilis limnetica TaxID=2033718 RepID=UPI0010575382|nr:hypothetical protein [Candidatus Methylomirabilis limnetica]
MANAWRGGQPAPNEPPHPLPGDTSGLATPPQRTTPESPNLETEREQRRAVHGHPVVPPRLAVDPGGSVSLQRDVRRFQVLDVVDVVQERREPHLLVPLSH